MKFYPVIIERGEDSSGCVGFGAFFPDLPGCVSGGDSLEDAIINAEKALEMHISALVRDNNVIPTPSSFEIIEHDPEINEILRTLVRVEIPEKWVDINVSPAKAGIQKVNAASPKSGSPLSRG